MTRERMQSLVILQQVQGRLSTGRAGAHAHLALVHVHLDAHRVPRAHLAERTLGLFLQVRTITIASMSGPVRS